MSCPICGHYTFSQTMHIQGYDLRLCRNCGHGVTDPLPSGAELTALYNETYFKAHYDEIFPSDPEFRKKIRQEDHRVKLVRKHKNCGRLLDVGCGRGYFLYACKSRFDCTGFDITTSNQEFIEQQLQVAFLSPDTAEIFENERFDVISFWHSLEHFPDPEIELRKLTKLLADDGVLIIDVPNHKAIDAFMEDEKWSGWDVPFHCHHFTAKSLAQLLSRLDFDIIDKKTYHCGYIRDRLKKHCLLRYVARPIAKMFAGSSVAMVCRKRNS